MFKKALHSILAATIAASPISASAADQYYFRYSTAISLKTVPPIEEEYGIGNDIVAYYVTPTNHSFTKKIPVATKDVVNWVKDSGEIPAGISLDESLGVFSGTPGVEATQTALFHGYDVQGHRIARAEVHFTVFEPVGSQTVVDFYGHTGSYFFGTVPSPDGIDVYSWEVVGDQGLPAGMSMTGSGFEGTPEAAGSYDLMLRGFDYLGREVAYATGTFLVEDGPKIEEVVASAGKGANGGSTREQFADQVADKSQQQSFSIVSTVKNSLGPVTYKLVPATARPAGIAFSSATGTLSGVFDDFDTSASFQIEARDSYDGTTGRSNVFKLTTLPAYLDLSAMKDLFGVVNTPYYAKLTSANVVAGAKWTVVQGTLPANITLNETTGELTGTPTTTEEQTDIVIAVSGTGMVSTQSSPFKFQIFSEAVTGKTNPLHARVDQPFATDGVTVVTGGSQGFSFAGNDLPAGVSIDPTTGVLSSTTGIPIAGSYDQNITINTPPGLSGPVWQVLQVHPELTVAYGDQTVKRRSFLNAYPSVTDDAIIGTPRYTLKPVAGAAIPSWLNFDQANGRLYGWPMNKNTAVGVYGPYQVMLSDDLSSKTSPSFTVEVEDRDKPSIVLNNKGVERFVNNYYTVAKEKDTVGQGVFSVVNRPANMPSTLRFAGAGYLIGTTDDPVGTVYQGMVVKVVDDENYEGTSDPFDLTVKEPDGLAGLYGSLDKSFEWTAGEAFSFTLPPLKNGYGTIAYGFKDALAGVGISDATKGTVSGTVATEGTYTAAYEIDDDTDRAPAQGTLTLKINPPLAVSVDPIYKANRAAPLGETAPTVTGGTAPFTYAIKSGALPAGVSYVDGVLKGTPTVEGDFPLTVTVTDKAGATKTVSFVLNVDKPLEMKVSYANTDVLSGYYSYVVATVKNAVGGVTTWSVSGAYPAGMTFNTSGDQAGNFTGVPSTTGRYKGITVTAVDSEGRVAVAPIEIGVSLNGPVDFADVALTHRKGGSFTDALAPAQVVAPLTFTSDDLTSLGLVLNGATGAITGSFPDEGTFTGVVSVEDDFHRKGSATITYTVVGDLTATAGDVILKRYVASAAAAPTLTNSIGPVTFKLASGTLPAGLSIDPNSGAVVGSSDDAGTYPGIVVEAKDSDGFTVNSNAFAVTVDERDALTLDAPDVYEFSQYVVGTVPVSSTNGIGTVVYTISPSLPTGLTLGSDGQITGTSDAKVDAASYVLTATDSKGGTLGTKSKTISISVRERDALEVQGQDVVEFVQYGVDQAPFPAVSAIGSVAYAINPDLPAGLVLDTTTGVISGSSDEEVPAATYVLTATDSKGGTRGTATKSISLKVKARDALELTGPDAYKFVQHASGTVSFPATNAIGAVAWSISPALPADLTLDTTNGTISGIATTKQDATDYVLTAIDEKGGTLGTATKTISITVGDRLPLTITTAAAQSVLLDHPYFMSLAVDNVVGINGVTWTHVSGDLPAGVTFDPTTGSFSGTPTDFGTTASVTIRATDDYEGLDERTFTFGVLQDGTPITLTGVGGTTRVGQTFDVVASSAANVVGNPTWSIDAGTTGVSINPKTGKLSGTPTTTYVSNVTLHVTDATGRTADAVVQMTSAPAISVVLATSNVNLVFNHDPAASPVATAIDTVGAVKWTVSGTLPQGVSIDENTGALIGKPFELGTFGPITVTAADTLPGTTKSSAFTIKVTMNDDPLELNVTDFVTKVGRPVSTVTPTYGNNLGPVSFFSTDLAGTGLAVNPTTGVLSGSALAQTDVYVNVSVKDRDTTRVTSKPVHYQVLPNMVVSVPTQVIVSALADMTPVTPSRMYVIGTSTWDALDQSAHKLPEGMSFDVTTGSLKGNPQEIGTFGPFTISSVDSVGDRGVSNSFVIKSNPGAIFISLAAATLPDATKRIETYSYDFKQGLTNVGMDESELVWTLGAGSPPGLTLVNGVLSGTPTLSGTYTFDVSASYGGVTAKRSYTLVVNLPVIDLQLAAATMADAKRAVTGKDNSYAFDFKSLATLKNIPADKVVYTIEAPVLPEAFPAGLAVSAGGVVSGTATAAKGDYAFRIKASFIDGTDENISVITAYTIKVTDEINFEFNAAIMDAPSKRLAYSFDLGGLIEPSTLKGVTTTQLAWSWAVDPANVTASTMQTVPAGLSISGSSVTGTPTNSGTYPLIITASYDGRTATKAITLVSALQTTSLTLPATLPDGMRTDAYSANLQTLSTAKNFPVAASTWSVANGTVGTGETAGLPPGVTLTSAGLLSGTPTIAGKYVVQITGRWNDANATAEAIQETKTYTITIAVKAGSYSQLEVYSHHTCVLAGDGVKCWGPKTFNGLTVNTSTPTSVPGVSSGVKQLATANGAPTHSCAIMTTGALKCWGTGTEGQLGNGASVDSATPVTAISSGVVSASVGGDRTCAVLSDGTAKCWGLNTNGELGDGTKVNKNSPVTVAGATDIKQFAMGYGHTCYLTNAGGVKCIGLNTSAQLGNGTKTSSATLVDVTGLSSGVERLYAGSLNTCAKMTTGATMCWGSNSSGTLGISGATSYATPTRIADFDDLKMGQGHVCGVINGAAKCMGQGAMGRLGNGGTTDVGSPTTVSGLGAGVAAAKAGYYFSCALMQTGAVKCWGTNTSVPGGVSNVPVDVSE
jgi:alpha-tubulin suppressor-like RCC1 family protein